MTERSDLSEEIIEVAQQAVTIVKFWDTGEVPAPNLPIGEAEAVIEQNKDAVKSFSSKIMGILTGQEFRKFWNNPQHYPGRFLYLDRSYDRGAGNDRPVVESSIEFVEQGDLINIVFRKRRCGRSTHPDIVDKSIEKFQSDLNQSYPASEGNEWQFEVSRSDEVYSLEATKNLETNDLASDLHLFGGFIRGANRIFASVQNRIAGLTITSEQSMRLLAITDSCLRATAIIDEVIE